MVDSALAASPLSPQSAYGELLVGSLGAVAVVCVLAFAVVRIFGQRGGLGLLGGGRRRGGLLEVIARQPLEPRRSLYVVRAGTRTILVGTSELGVTMLTELEGIDAEAPAVETAGPTSFAELVRAAGQRFGGRRGKGGNGGNAPGGGSAREAGVVEGAGAAGGSGEAAVAKAAEATAGQGPT